MTEEKEPTKNKYRVTFIQEEYLTVEIYAIDEDQAYWIAKDCSYQDFESGDCDLSHVETILIKKDTLKCMN